jgi:xanthine dehydrogenase accessory factor
MQEFYEKITEFLEEYPTLAVATVTATEGSTPRKSDAKMIVLPGGGTYGTIGGGALEHMVIEDALKAIASGASLSKTYKLDERARGGIGQICGGTTSVFIEVVKGSSTILLCGGGHIAQAMAPMIAALGMNLIVIDDREEIATRERFPTARKVVHAVPSDPDLRRLVTPSTSIVIVTHRHKHDKEALQNFIATDAAYIGMIGSKKKVRATLDELQSEGVPAKALSRVHSPIGLDIGAETPAEIAISILSEIIHVIRKGSTSPGSMKIAPAEDKKKK